MRTFAKLFLLLTLTSAALSGCSITRPRAVYATFVDYRPYTEAGFFLSPDPYTGKYESLGELTIEVFPAITTAPKTSPSNDSDFSDGLYHNQPAPSSAYLETIDSSEMLELAVGKALELGANGLVNLDISIIYDETRYGITVNHYVISGLCIKILE